MVWISPLGPNVDIEHRKSVCRLANAVRCLSRLCLPIFLVTVMNVFKLSMDMNIAIQDMSRTEFLSAVVNKEAERRQEMAL